MDKMIKEDFSQKWAAKTLPGWFGEDASAADGEAEAAKKNNPLYCEACDKVFANEAVFKAHLKGKKHKRAVAALENAQKEGKKPAAAANNKVANSQKESLALVEYTLSNYTEMLEDVVEATVSYIERKQ